MNFSAEEDEQRERNKVLDSNIFRTSLLMTGDSRGFCEAKSNAKLKRSNNNGTIMSARQKRKVEVSESLTSVIIKGNGEHT